MASKDKTNKPAAIAAVRLERPGVKSCGPYKAGVIYRIGDEVAQAVVLTPDEAVRLVEAKGFTPLTETEIARFSNQTTEE